MHGLLVLVDVAAREAVLVEVAADGAPDLGPEVLDRADARLQRRVRVPAAHAAQLMRLRHRLALLLEPPEVVLLKGLQRLQMLQAPRIASGVEPELI